MSSQAVQKLGMTPQPGYNQYQLHWLFHFYFRYLQCLRITLICVCLYCPCNYLKNHSLFNQPYGIDSTEKFSTPHSLSSCVINALSRLKNHGKKIDIFPRVCHRCFWSLIFHDALVEGIKL